MKKIWTLIFAVVLIVAVNGCKKDKLPEGYRPFGSEAGNEIVSHESYINERRGGLSHPDACEAIATLGRNELITVFFDELIDELDGFTTKATKIYRDPKEWEEFLQSDLTRSKLIRKLGDERMVDYDVRRVLSYYSKALKDKAIVYVIDGICFGGGVRDQWSDDCFHYSFNDTIGTSYEHDSWKVIYSDEIYYYYFYYAVDPGNYAKATSAGMQTPTVAELQVMFPYEEIMRQTDLNVYRNEVLKKYDFTTQKGWTPTTAPVTIER